MTIELDKWHPSGPIEVRCPHCETGGATYLPSEDGVRCESCPRHDQPYDYMPLILRVTVTV